MPVVSHHGHLSLAGETGVAGALTALIHTAADAHNVFHHARVAAGSRPIA